MMLPCHITTQKTTTIPPHKKNITLNPKEPVSGIQQPTCDDEDPMKAFSDDDDEQIEEESIQRANTYINFGKEQETEDLEPRPKKNKVGDLQQQNQ